jgi:small-conductance mechanosensitive channel
MKTLSNTVSTTFIFAIFILLGVMVTTSPVDADAIADLLGTKPEKAEVEQSTKVITTDNTAVSDRKISKRLGEIYAELDTLNKLRVAVNKGVVTLTGEVTSSSVQEKASSLAKKVEGVVEVENEIVVTRSIEKRLETTWNKILKLGKQAVSNLPLFIIALVVFSLFWFIGGWVSRRKGLFHRLSNNAFIATLLGQIAHIIFIIIGLVIALSLLDATALLGTIMGAAGIFGLAIGFAVRDTVENYISSVLLSLRNPFQVNDYVDIDGNEGNVARLTSRATILITSDGNHVRIPNAQVFKAIITNFTRNSERRFSFDLGVDSAQDLDEAQLLAIETMNKIEGVLDNPKPAALVVNLGDFNVIVRAFGWVDQKHYSFSKVRSETVKKVKVAFDEADIIMPEPIYQVRVSENANILAGKQTSTGSTESKVSKKETLKKSKPKKVSAEVNDITPDDTAKEHIQEEHDENNTENLLSSQTPSE